MTVHRTVYAIVKNATGEIEALCLSRRDCDKLLRGAGGHRIAGGSERVEEMHDVGWPTWEEWVQERRDLNKLFEQPPQSALAEVLAGRCRRCQADDVQAGFELCRNCLLDGNK